MTIQEQIQAYIYNLKQAELLLEHLPTTEQFGFKIDISPYVNQYSASISVRLPYNQEYYTEFRRAMGNGWTGGKWYTTQHGGKSVSRHTSFTWPGIEKAEVMIAMHTDIETSICQIKQVGVKEVPILEVVCS